MKQLLLIIVTVFSFKGTFAQYNSPHNMKWAFGYGAGLDFSTGSPVPFSSSISTLEGCASLCDASGNLLFYTDGVTVWDNTHAAMPSGSAIVSYATSSSTQGSLITSVLGAANKYYLFSLEEISFGTGYCNLNYCIVDMSLHGGLGDVVSGSTGTFIANKMSEKMIIVAGNNCDLWLVTHRIDSAKFLVYNITGAGISAPATYSLGTFTGGDAYGIGQLKVSPDRQHILLQGYYTANGTELYDFNPGTGVVSNCQLLDSVSSEYGAEFSPNNRYIYCDAYGSHVDQYDITTGTTAGIRASRTTVVSTPIAGDMKLAPNGKIYFGDAIGGVTVGCISNPNVAGSGCGYIASVATLTGGATFGAGLPNVYVEPPISDTTIRKFDTAICIAAGGSTLTADTIGSVYYWNTGETTSTKNITAYGTYWVYIKNQCAIRTDSFHVVALPTDVHSHSMDTIITAPTGYTAYLWNTGSSSSSISASTSGVYTVNCSIGCTILYDTFNVTVVPYVFTESIIDTSYCFPGSLHLNIKDGHPGYVWQDGTAGPAFTVHAGGTYWAVSTEFCKAHADTFHITPVALTINIGPDVNTCMNYNIVPSLLDKDATYLWQDGYTGQIYNASRTGNYYVTVRLGGCEASDTMKVNFIHLSQNIPDTFICKGIPFEIPLVATVPPGGSIVWDNGSTNPVRTVHDSGTYWVYVKEYECEILDTIRVVTGYCDCWYDVPTAFTPNADGLNDIIRPIIQPGCTTSGYQFNIYNRWGELVFTSSTPGKGWDGVYGGVPADMGVYYYSLNLYVGVYNKPASQNGNFTLIR
jgi:gliding motility-associated-like protein